jgi:heme/copper-type cytochrome/quinol oxidase subunit 2
MQNNKSNWKIWSEKITNQKEISTYINGIILSVMCLIVFYIFFILQFWSVLFFEVGFIDSGSEFYESLIRLYNYVWFFLFLIVFFFIVMLGRIIYLFTFRAVFYKNIYIKKIIDFCFLVYLVIFSIFEDKSKLFIILNHFNKFKNDLFMLNIWYSSDDYFFFLSKFSSFFNKDTTVDLAELYHEHLKNQFNEVTELTEYKKLEIIWCTLPASVLVLIISPSFDLIYSLDMDVQPAYTIKVIGHQSYWVYQIEGELEIDENSEYIEHSNLYKQLAQFTDEKNLVFPKHKINFEEFFYNSMFLKNTIQFNVSIESVMIPFEDLKEGTHRLLEVDNRLILPIGVPLKFLVTSVDVLHSWAVPAFGLKVDAVPGRLNQFISIIQRPGIYYGQCSELCGYMHGFMVRWIAFIFGRSICIL